MKDKTSWFLRLEDPATGQFGLGECGPLPGLSVDDRPDFEEQLAAVLAEINRADLAITDDTRLYDLIPQRFPSILFGAEVAMRDLQNGGRRIIFDNGFLEGKPIPINGLIWMGDMDFMMDQINRKIAEGFRCIKLKVGGLDFDRERDIVSYIRRKYFREDITIRLDANGAFRTDDVLYRLDELAKFDIHSIEQPIRPGLSEMEELCRKSPIPVAFDEELIGVHAPAEKSALLKKLKPQFIVLKPTLHGGIRGCEEWIRVAESLQIGWWMTSALESSVGLNAICQFASQYDLTIPQGLGTGAIYTDNFSSPLTVSEGRIFFDHKKTWEAL